MSKGVFLFKQGDVGNFYYIVKEGELELTYPTGDSKILIKGDSFGELALIQKNARSTTVSTLTDIELYCLEGEIFKEIILKMNNNNLKERLSLLNIHPLFKYFGKNEIHEIAVNMLKCQFDKGEVIEENELKDSLFLVVDGYFSDTPNNLDLTNKKIQKNILNDFFGLSGLINANKRCNRIIIAERYSKCFRITKGVLSSILGDDFLKKILTNLTKNAFNRIKMLKLLSRDEYFDKIFPVFKLNFYSRNDVLFDLTETEQKFVILLEGTLIDVRNILIFFFRVIQMKF